VANRRKVDRGEQVRAAKATAKRTARVLGRLLLLSAIVGGAGWGARALWTFATTSPRFAIRTIAVTGVERAGEDELRGLLGIAPGDNLFTADTGAARERLLTHPWVREARVERRFPQGIAVTVLERQPRALVDLGHLYLVDDKDEIFKRALPGDPADLPVITGVAREDWTERPREARERLREAVELLDAVERRQALAELPPAEVHLDEAEGPTLYLGDGETAVKLGRDGIEAKLDRLERILAELERRGERAELVRLDNRTRPGWIAARLAVATGGPGAGTAGADRRGKAAAP
jgi:cell division protein FtsQ